MGAIYHSNLFTTVNRRDEEAVVARCFLISTDTEAVVHLIIDAASFAVREANWEIYRSPQGIKSGRVPGLEGVEAYLNAGPALRQVGEVYGRLIQALVADCVKGVIQAETYLFRERGFETPAAYEAAWKSSYKGSCRLYSNLERITQSWYDHVANRKWGECLFNRYKTAAVNRRGSSFTASGCFSDSFHELGLSITADGDRITQAEASFLRAPDSVCYENVELINSVIGKPLSGLTKATLGQLTGGSWGCNHLVDLLDHVVASLSKAVTSNQD